MFFSKKNHKIPSYPKEIAKIFKSYCIDIDNEKDIETLKIKVIEEVENAKKRKKEGMYIDVKMAEEIAKRCLYLLKNFSTFSQEQKRLVTGGVCYFAVSDDPLSEEIFASGYDDDAKIINHVLEEIGIDDMYIDLE